jgi:hypothetical protein
MNEYIREGLGGHIVRQDGSVVVAKYWYLKYTRVLDVAWRDYPYHVSADYCRSEHCYGHLLVSPKYNWQDGEAVTVSMPTDDGLVTCHAKLHCGSASVDVDKIDLCDLPQVVCVTFNSIENRGGIAVPKRWKEPMVRVFSVSSPTVSNGDAGGGEEVRN